MNRLVLIGNGFDLAHGLKTRYQDFIDWYWQQRVNELGKIYTNVASDYLCTLRLLSNPYTNTWHMYAWENQQKLHENTGAEIIKELEKIPEYYSIEKVPFFEAICYSKNVNKWVDIENIYYLALKDILSEHHFNSIHQTEEVKKLNSQLVFLQGKLIEYLSTLSIKKELLIPTLENKIYSPICSKELSVDWIADQYNQYLTKDSPDLLSDEDFDDEVLEHILVLNFNYTDTASFYLKGDEEVSMIQIHGQLKNPDSIIFGYGDELDKDFKDLKERNENVLLNHVKSIRYLESDNYRKMLQFIDSAPFQIYIMGHSCGNSDRTLLNTLFEHKNCISIKPFYYTWTEKDKNGTEHVKDNYLELVQNISRNFTDMKLMRDRVVNKTYCKEITK